MLKDLPKPTKTNPRGIPEAPFLTDINDYCANIEDATHLLQILSTQMQKYQFMESSTRERVKSLLDKIPDIQKSLDMAKFLKNRSEPFNTQYELNDTVYAEAEIPPTDTVMVWLGASTMLEYPIPEAIELLASKLEAAHKNLDQCNEDLEFLKESITTMEVNTARAVNFRIEKGKAKNKIS